MRLRELLKNVEICQIACDIEQEITQIVYDSRKAGPGCLYIAARRVGADGHDYIPDAVKNGAAVVLAGRPVEGVPYVVVTDSNKAMATIAGNFYGNPAQALVVVGITGTKGKSASTFMLRTILERLTGEGVGVIGTVGVFLGDEMIAPAKNTTPETPELHELFARLIGLGCRYVVMEVSSHSLAIDRVYGIPFKAAAFTNLSQDHLDYHKTMEAYLQAKARLFTMTDAAVVNIDDLAAGVVLAAAVCERIIGFGLQAGAALRGENLRHSASGGVSFDALWEGARVPVQLPSPGTFMAYNALTALGLALALGFPFREAAEALSVVEPLSGRLQRVDAGQDFRVLVDYAHTPESVRQVSETAREFTAGRLISVFGCGGDRDRTKRPLMAEAAAAYGDILVITTDNPRFEEPGAIIADILPGVPTGMACRVIEDRREAIAFALSAAKAGDTVLIMGKGHETYQEVRGVRSHFSDVEEVEMVLKQR